MPRWNVDIIVKCQLYQAVAKVLIIPLEWKAPQLSGQGASGFCDPHLQLLRRLHLMPDCAPHSRGLFQLPPRHQHL